MSGSTTYKINGKEFDTKDAADAEYRRMAEITTRRQKILDADRANVEKFIGEKGQTVGQFLGQDTDIEDQFQKWKVDKADQAYLDVKTQLLASPGRKSTLLADPIQGMSKLLGKSVL